MSGLERLAPLCAAARRSKRHNRRWRIPRASRRVASHDAAPSRGASPRRRPAGGMSALTFDVEQFKFVTSVACGREIARGRKTDKGDRGIREEEEESTTKTVPEREAGGRGRGGEGLDKGDRRGGEGGDGGVVAEEEGGLTVPRGATCLMN